MTRLDEATTRLVARAASLSDAEIAGPSALPGWTRGHVLAHIARNADSMINLVNWARTGVRTPQYPSRAVREAGIEEGASRPAVAQVDDVRRSADRFAAAAAAMTPEAWAARLDLPTGPAPATQIVWRRLREVEVHHVDLAAGYTPADWSTWFSTELLTEIIANLTERGEAPAMRLHATDIGLDIDLNPPGDAGTGGNPRHDTGTGGNPRHDAGTDVNPGGGAGTDPAPAGGSVAGTPSVTGSASALAAWLAGRSPGADLVIRGTLPPVPAWI